MLFSICIKTSIAQIINDGCNVAGFGINAWLYANGTQTTGYIPPIGSLDWFRNTTGRNVINQSNPAEIQTLLTNNFNPIFQRRMNGSLSSLADDVILPSGNRSYKILIDAVWGRDMFGGTGGIDQTSYETASKNGEDPAIWDLGPANVLGKNDLLDVAGHMFRDVESTAGGEVVKNDLWFVGLINRAEPGGDAYMDFEFLVRGLEITGTGSNQKFNSGGPNLGHTAFLFEPDPDNSGKHRIARVGDLIFNMSLTGGGSTVDVKTRIWVRLADRLSIIPTNFDWGLEYDGAFNGSPFVYAEIIPKQAGIVCGYVNREGQLPPTPPWGSRGTKTNSIISNYAPFSVAEMGMNLTALGLDHASLSGLDPCYFPLNTFIVKTRSSNSFTSQLKDFSGPYSWGQPSVSIISDDNPVISCETPTVTLRPDPYRPDVTYTWSTIGGNILSTVPNGGIVVDRQGSYYVIATLPDNCPIRSDIFEVPSDPTKPFFNEPLSFSTTVPCGGNDGTVTVTASGGTKPYTFYLYNSSGGLIRQFTGNATQSSYTFTSLVPGTYRADVKGVYACNITTGEFTIPARTPLNYTPAVTPILCFGEKTGKIELGTVTGKTPITYSWSTGNQSKDLLNVGAGTYTVNITDGDGCVTTEEFTITQPTDIVASITKTDDPGNAGNGSATVNVSGGTEPYVYEWRKTPEATVIGTSATLANIGYGEYTVKVTDANGCFKSFSVFIYEKERCDPGNSLIDNDGDGLIGCDDPDCVPPTPESLVADAPIPCKGDVVDYTATSPAGTNYDSYVWTIPGNATFLDNLGDPTTDPAFTTGPTIMVRWNTTDGGEICVQGKIYSCLSAAKCIQVSVNDVPKQPGTIIVTGGN